jgi:hypothetical protein
MGKVRGLHRELNTIRCSTLTGKELTLVEQF